MSGDRARISVTVAVPPELAFEIFTEQIDLWWRRGPKFRHAGIRAGLIHLEPKLGGRLFESFPSGSDTTLFECGRVLQWEPPDRLAFSWRNATFKSNEITRVDVEFQPTRSGTLVTVTHSGWAALPADHPARHGLQGADFARMIGMWWSDQLTSLRMQAGDSRSI